jgi:hypothetical protein
MATLASPILQIVYLICLVASNNNLTITFHAIYGIAAVLPVVIIVLRIFMVDSTLFHNSNFINRRRSFRLYLLLARRYWWRIFTTSLAFFLYDCINFPNSIMSSSIIASLVKDDDIRKTAIWQVVLAVLPVPGVMVGAWLTNAIGRRNTGIMGFAGYMLLGFIIGGTYSRLSKNIAAFVVLYGLLQAFGHMGPGATIGLISSEAFPTAMRGMGYGIATAFGRTGAAVGTECFTPCKKLLEVVRHSIWLVEWRSLAFWYIVYCPRVAALIWLRRIENLRDFWRSVDIAWRKTLHRAERILCQYYLLVASFPTSMY